MRTKNVVFMIAVLLAFIAQGAIWYTMPLIFAQTFGNDYFEVGLLIALIPLMEVIAAIPFGYFADIGKIKTITFDSMLALLLTPFLFTININIFTAMGTFLFAAGGVGIWIATNAYVANVFGRREIKYIGYELALMGMGWVTGPMLGGLIYDGFGKIALAVTEMLVIAIASFLFLRTLEVETPVRNSRAPKFMKILKIQNRVIHRLPAFVFPFLLLSFIFSYLELSVWVAVPLITVITSSSVLLGGFMIGIINIPSMVGEALGGKLYRRGEEKKIVSLALVLAALSMVASAIFLNQSFYALVILLATALFTAFAYVGIFSAVIERDTRDTGEISALATVTGGFGGALAAVIAGATVATYKLQVVAGVFCVLVFLYLLYLRFAFKDSEF